MTNSLIKINHLPELEERFAEKKKELGEIVERCQTLAVSDENRKEVKKIRADLNKDAKAYREEFKAVKEQIMEPWIRIEDAFKESIRQPYEEADAALKEKIAEVENQLKAEKAEDIKRYFDEYAEAVNVTEWTSWERSPIRVTLSDSVKALKAEAKEYLDRIAQDLELIETQDNKERILAEFAESLDARQAITKVKNQIEKENELKKTAETRAEEEKAEIKRQEEQRAHLTAPVKEAPEEKLEITFRVTGTIEQLRSLAAFLNEKGITYAEL